MLIKAKLTHGLEWLENSHSVRIRIKPNIREDKVANLSEVTESTPLSKVSEHPNTSFFEHFQTTFVWLFEHLKGNSHDFQVRVRYKALAHKALSKRFYIFTWLLYCRSSAERKRRVEVGAVDDAAGSYPQSMRSHSMR